MLHKNPSFRKIHLVICVSVCLFITSVFSAHIHSKERVEDGAYSPKLSNHNVKKTESEFTHEVMLGSAKEAEEFDHLTPEESKKRLSLLLTKIDTNGNKFVDPEELYAWIIKSFKKLSEEEAEERFDDADLNKDDKITWKEQLMDSFGEEGEFGETDSEDELLMKADKRLFEAADLNRDGVLDKAEYKRFCNPEDFGDMLPILIQNTLEEKDLNKDGHIDFEEFIGDKSKMHDNEYIISEKASFEVNYDKNKDGVLSSEEIISWVVPNSSQIAIEETRHLLAAADDNHDSLLSYDEVIENHDVFVGSEATDFGEHLQNIHVIMDEL